MQTIRVFRLTLPNDSNVPAQTLKSRFDICVPGNISLEFIRPVGCPRFGKRGFRATRVPMPKATMYEERDSAPREGQIWTAREISSMEPEAESHMVQCTSHPTFRRRVFRFNAGHEPRPALRRNMVDHR